MLMLFTIVLKEDTSNTVVVCCDPFLKPSYLLVTCASQLMTRGNGALTNLDQTIISMHFFRCKSRHDGLYKPKPILQSQLTCEAGFD